MMEDDLAIMGGAQVGFQGVETGFGGGLERMQAVLSMALVQAAMTDPYHIHGSILSRTRIRLKRRRSGEDAGWLGSLRPRGRRCFPRQWIPIGRNDLRGHLQKSLPRRQVPIPDPAARLVPWFVPTVSFLNRIKSSVATAMALLSGCKLLLTESDKA